MSVSEDVNAWIAFVLYAVVGRMAAADQVLSLHGPAVKRQAKRQAKRQPVKSRTLYRGILLNDGLPVGGSDFFSEEEEALIKPGRREDTDELHRMGEDGQISHAIDTMRFVSHTESLETAQWFASPTSAVSGHVSFRCPNVQGYIITVTKAPSRILWHHSWTAACAPNAPNGASIPLAYAARMHPEICMFASQFEWNMQTQQEVILEPSSRRFPIEPIGEVDVDTLNKRFSPPGVSYEL